MTILTFNLSTIMKKRLIQCLSLLFTAILMLKLVTGQNNVHTIKNGVWGSATTWSSNLSPNFGNDSTVIDTLTISHHITGLWSESSSGPPYVFEQPVNVIVIDPGASYDVIAQCHFNQSVTLINKGTLSPGDLQISGANSHIVNYGTLWFYDFWFSSDNSSSAFYNYGTLESSPAALYTQFLSTDTFHNYGTITYHTNSTIDLLSNAHGGQFYNHGTINSNGQLFNFSTNNNGFYNSPNGVINQGNQEYIENYGTFLNDGIVKCNGLVNYGDIKGNGGLFCISDTSYNDNSGIINGALTLCDVTSTSGSVLDANLGTVGSNVQQCSSPESGPCGFVGTIDL